LLGYGSPIQVRRRQHTGLIKGRKEEGARHSLRGGRNEGNAVKVDNNLGWEDTCLDVATKTALTKKKLKYSEGEGG